MNKIVKTLLISTLIISILVLFFGWYVFFSPNINQTKDNYLYVNTNDSKAELGIKLMSNGIVKNNYSFEIASKILRFNNVKPGKYNISNVNNNLALIKMLRSGNQEPVKFTFQKIRTLRQLASIVGQKLEIDSNQFYNFLNTDDSISKFGFSPENSISMFLPNTYELWWNIDIEAFLNKMKSEHDKFWNRNEIQEKLKNQNLTSNQVTIIASIVDEETNQNDEKEQVAGVYINRFRIGMKLEADPTVKFAVGDFTIKRIINIHLKKQSPFNTYMYAGLPPGPICTPSISSINAVLNYKKHNFLYFCAKEDFSGYHNFSPNFQGHLENARKYQAALNKRKIF